VLIKKKFHHLEILFGAGKSTKALLAILNKGWEVRKGMFINYDIIRIGPLNNLVIFTTTIKVINK